LKQPSLEKSNSKKSAILIARQQGGIGDLLMLTPTIRAIKEQNPDTLLIVSTTGDYSSGVLLDILTHNPYIDKIVGVQDLINYNFLKVYNFGTSEEVVIESDPAHPTGNRIDIFAEMAEVELKDKQTIYVVTDEEKKWAKEWIHKNIYKSGYHGSEEKKLVGIHVHTMSTKRNWPEEKLMLLAFQIVNTWSDTSVLLFCEGSTTGIFKDYPNIYTIFGLPISQVAALMDECEIFVAPDSGLLHLAGALKKKTIAKK